MQKTKAIFLAIGLGAALLLGGCTETEQEAQDAANKGRQATQQAKDKAGEMASEAEKSASEAANTASTTFNDATAVTEETAASFKGEAMSAYDSMEEQFNKTKESLDENVVQDLQAKFTSLKTKLDALGDKTGTELVQALNEVKTEGAELAAELKSATGVSVEATPADSTAEATPEPTATP